jgi:hypothetical protein
MKIRCEREDETIRALRSGSWPSDLLQHHEHCLDCRQTRQVAQALQQDAALFQSHSVPHPAIHVWSAVQRRQKLAAFDRTTRFLRLLKVAGILYATIFVLWSLRALPGLPTESLLPGLTGKALSDSLAGAGLAAIFVCSGLIYALRRDRPSTN